MIPDADSKLMEPERVAGCVVDQINAQARTWQRQNRRPRGLSAREALATLQFEALLIATVALNIVHGVELLDEDMQRLMLAYQRVDQIATEAAG